MTQLTQHRPEDLPEEHMPILISYGGRTHLGYWANGAYKDDNGNTFQYQNEVQAWWHLPEYDHRAFN